MSVPYSHRKNMSAPTVVARGTLSIQKVVGRQLYKSRNVVQEEISDQKEVVARVCLFENSKSNWQNMNACKKVIA
jgi:hypothetical protein